jgi:hypothetical protein
MSIQPIAEPRLGPEENIKIDLKGMLWGSNWFRTVTNAGPSWTQQRIFTHHSLMELSPSWEAANCTATQEIIPAFYGTRRFIAVLTRVFHWPLSSAREIQSIPSHPISLRSILILFTYLRLAVPSGPSTLKLNTFRKKQTI